MSAEQPQGMPSPEYRTDNAATCRIAKVGTGIFCVNGPLAGHDIEVDWIRHGVFMCPDNRGCMAAYHLGYVYCGFRCRPFLRVLDEPFDARTAWDIAGLDHEVDAISLGDRA